MPRSFSQSALSSAYKCNRLYQCLYVDKLTPQDKPSGDMLFGTGMHLGLETMLSPDGGDFKADFKLFWDLEKEKDNRYGRFSHSDLESQGLLLLDRFKRLHAKKIKIFQSEKRLYGNIKDVRVEGTPDILGWYEGIPSVIDFKTSGYRYADERAMLSEQMFLYAYLAETANFKPEQLVYIVFIKGSSPSIQTIKYKFQQEELNASIENVYNQCKDLLHKEDKNMFTQNKNNCILNSVRCGFYDHCHKKEEREK